MVPPEHTLALRECRARRGRATSARSAYVMVMPMGQDKRPKSSDTERFRSERFQSERSRPVLEELGQHGPSPALSRFTGPSRR